MSRPNKLVNGNVVPLTDAEWAEYQDRIENPPSVPVPQIVTRRQILTALGALGWITEGEAEAALTTGQRPAVVDLVIGSMPQEHRFGARMKWAGFLNAYRSDAMVAALAAATERDDADIDALFTLADTID
jgi:hypothetical protein